MAYIYIYVLTAISSLLFHLAVDFDMKKLRLRLYLGGNYGRNSADHKTPQRDFLEVIIAWFEFGIIL